MSKVINRWSQLCKTVKQDDGLPTRPARSWTEDKLWWWNRYLDITTKALVGRNKWPFELVYVDLFAGPGVLKHKSGRRIPGSPLVAVQASKPFSKILLCEKDSKLATACEKRARKFATTQTIRVFEGDCNQSIRAVVDEIPNDALTPHFPDDFLRFGT